jgi:DNA replication protein DnaC
VLFELIAPRYESASLIITSNQPFSAWDSIFSDSMMTVAAIDRLIHHASIIDIQGESYRKTESIATIFLSQKPAKVIVAEQKNS